jgi:hypothetical protein
MTKNWQIYFDGLFLFYQAFRELQMYVCIPEAGVWFLRTTGMNPLRNSLRDQPTHQGLFVFLITSSTLDPN